LCIARQQLIAHAVASLPKFGRAMRFIDLGCGDGALTRELLQALCASGHAQGIEEILIIDASANMLTLARQGLTAAFPEARITAIEGRAEAVIDQIPRSYDVLLSSLAWHHMPYQIKEQLARSLGQCVHHILLYEVEANHDTPELHSPALAVSLYQVYGGIIKLVMDHPAPQEVIEACIDRFLVGELVSLLTQPRGIRSDYHMLRRQWHQLFMDGLGADFECLGDITCWSDSEIDLFLLHYGRST
jgi:SAM-dependent methyltransferase